MRQQAPSVSRPSRLLRRATGNTRANRACAQALPLNPCSPPTAPLRVIRAVRPSERATNSARRQQGIDPRQSLRASQRDAYSQPPPHLRLAHVDPYVGHATVLCKSANLRTVELAVPAPISIATRLNPCASHSRNSQRWPSVRRATHASSLKWTNLRRQRAQPVRLH